MSSSSETICAKCKCKIEDEHWYRLTSTKYICPDCRILFISELEQLKCNFIQGEENV